MVTIRPAVAADADQLSLFYRAIQRLHAEAAPLTFKPVGEATFPPSDWLGILEDPANLVFMADLDGGPAGYVYARIGQMLDNWGMYPNTYAHIRQITVAPDHQGTGVGQALMSQVRQAAKARNVETLSLDVWRFNERARRFFDKQGFPPVTEFRAARL